jgi:hypothetical protein
MFKCTFIRMKCWNFNKMEIIVIENDLSFYLRIRTDKIVR